MVEKQSYTSLQRPLWLPQSLSKWFLIMLMVCGSQPKSLPPGLYLTPMAPSKLHLQDLTIQTSTMSTNPYHPVSSATDTPIFLVWLLGGILFMEAPCHHHVFKRAVAAVKPSASWYFLFALVYIGTPVTPSHRTCTLKFSSARTS